MFLFYIPMLVYLGERRHICVVEKLATLYVTIYLQFIEKIVKSQVKKLENTKNLGAL